MSNLINKIIQLVAYGLIVIGGLIAVYFLLGNPKIAITVVSFIATGLIVLGVQYLWQKNKLIK